MDSKKALIKPGIDCDIIYGKAPIKEKNIHEKETIKLASFFVNDSISWLGRLKIYNNKPNRNAIKPEIKNGFTGSENRSATNVVANNAAVRINKLFPTIGKFNLRLKILPILCL